LLPYLLKKQQSRRGMEDWIKPDAGVFSKGGLHGTPGFVGIAAG
jgi:hypothetical protein